MASVYRRGATYWVRFRVNGVHVRRSARTAKKAEAMAYLHRLVAEYTARARDGLPRHTYDEAAERFLREASIRSTTHASYTTSDRSCSTVLAGKYLDEIDRRLLGELVAARKAKGVSDTTIRRDLAFLSSMCASAVAWGWLDANPVTQFSKRHLKEARPRTRFLTRDEYDALLAAASDRLRPAIVLAVETGLRREELFSLTVAAIDFPRREVVLDKTKSDIPRRVPLTDTALVTIRAILSAKDRPKGAVHLFVHSDGERIGNLKKAFWGACRRAKIKDLRWHDLRHTFASWFIQAGGEVYHLSRILGHSTIQMTTRYSHLRTQDLHLAVERAAQNRAQEQETRTATQV